MRNHVIKNIYEYYPTHFDHYCTNTARKNVKEARRERLYFKCLSWWYVYVRFSMQEGYVSLSSVGEHDKAQEHLENKDKAAIVI